MGALEGRVAIITGAGRGIGREHALLFASEGAKVVVNDLGGAVDGSGDDRTPAQQVVDEIKQMGGEAIANADNVADWEGGQRLVNAAVEAFGDLHVLVNNAGILRDRVLVNMTEDEWDAVIHVHSEGPLRPHALGRGLLARAVEGGQQGQRRRRQHLLDLRLARQPRPVELRRRQGRPRGVHRHRRPGAVPLRRTGQRHRPGSPHADDRVDARPVRHRAAAARPGRVRRLGPRQRLAARRLPRQRACPLTGKVFFVQGGKVQYFQPWTLTDEIDKGDRWTVAELVRGGPEDRFRRRHAACCPAAVVAAAGHIAVSVSVARSTRGGPDDGQQRDRRRRRHELGGNG